MKTAKHRHTKSFYIAAAIALIAASSIASLTVNDAKKDSSAAASSISQKSTSSTASVYSAPQITVSSEEKSVSPTPSTADTESEKAEEVATEKPVTFAMPIKANITKQFSTEQLIYSETYGDMRVHTGIDIEAETGTLVKASGNGTVKEVADDKITGKTVIIDHGNNISSYYCGLNDASVKAGDKVNAGKVIGTVGENPSECLDKSHLHFAIKSGDKWLSPLQAMGLE